MCPPGGTYSIGGDSHSSATDLPVGPVGWGPDHTRSYTYQGDTDRRPKEPIEPYLRPETCYLRPTSDQ